MLTNEQLAVQARAGDTRAMDTLLARFDGLAAHLALAFYDDAADRDDLHQEAMIAVYHAVRDYRPGHDTYLATFVVLVVKRHLISYLKTATRVKHLMLTHAVRDLVDDDGEEHAAVDLVPAVASDPFELLVDRADFDTVLRVIAEALSPLERKVLLSLADGGETMRALQARLGFPLSENSLDSRGRPRAKVVENAWQRAQTKLRCALAEAA